MVSLIAAPQRVGVRNVHHVRISGHIMVREGGRHMAYCTFQLGSI